MIQLPCRSLFTLILLFGTTGFAAVDFCEPVAVSDKDVARRATTIPFPDGRLVTVIGHDHGDRRVPAELQNLAKAFAENGSVHALELGLNRIPTRNRDGIHDQESNLSFLRRRLKGQHGIQFISKEVDPAMFQNSQLFLIELREDFQRAFKMYSVSPPKQLARAQLLAEEASTFYSLNHLSLGLGYTMFGAESKTASEAFSVADKQLNEAYARLLDVVGDHPKIKRTLLEGRYEIYLMAENQLGPLNEAELIAKFEKQMPKRLHEAGRKWIAAEVKKYEAHEKRDEATAKNLVDRRQSGIHFVGMFHFKSLIQKLQKSCEVERDGQPATRPTYPTAR